MENYMMSKNGEDHICVILYICKTRETIIGHIYCAQAQDLELFNHMIKEHYKHKWGCTRTYGELLHERDPTIPKNDWMSIVLHIPRVNKLEEALNDIYIKYMKQANYYTIAEALEANL